MDTFCLERLSSYFKLNCLGETELQNHGSFETVPKRKTQNDAAPKEEVLQALNEGRMRTGKAEHKKDKVRLGS